jgi:alpha/beta superfamily hydrolase
MTVTQMPLREFTGPAGRLEALLEEPMTPPEAGLRAAVVFAHPHPEYGGTLHNKVVYQASKSLVGLGCAVLRFNFRGVGASEGRWSEGRGEREDYRAALDLMVSRYPATALWADGFSFGAWVALTEGALDPRVSVLIGIAPSVGMHDFSAVKASTKPKFLIHGESDQLFPLKAVYEFYGQLHEPRELAVIDAADHLFDGKVSEVGDALEELLADFHPPTN